MRDAAGTSRLLYAPEDSHWNADEHAFVADQLLSVWNRLGLDVRKQSVVKVQLHSTGATSALRKWSTCWP